MKRLISLVFVLAAAAAMGQWGPPQLLSVEQGWSSTAPAFTPTPNGAATATPTPTPTPTATPTPAPPSFVQANGIQPGANVGASSISVAFTAPVTAGNTLVLFVSSDTNADPTAIGDNVNGANSWSIASATNHDWLTGTMYYFSGAGAGTTTVTVQYGTSAANRSLYIAEYSGLLVVDKSAGHGLSGSSNAPTSTAPGLPVSDGQLFVSGLYCSNENAVITAGNALSFTKRKSLGDSFSYSGAIEDAIQPTAAATAANWSLGSSESYICMLATFKRP
jgi:hypothetical protein